MNNVAWCHKFLFKKINLFLVFLKFLTMNKLILLSLLYRTKGITSPFPLWPVKLIRNHFGEFFRKISMIKNFIPITRLGKAEILWGFSRKERNNEMYVPKLNMISISISSLMAMIPSWRQFCTSFISSHERTVGNVWRNIWLTHFWGRRVIGI